jgi:hypothetical protein
VQAFSRLRLAAVLLAGGLLAVALAGATRSDAAGASGIATPTQARSIDAQPGTALRADRLAAAAVSWRGGPITTSTGEVVEVFVSDTLPVETVTPEYWAEFLAKLTHGPELASVTSYHAPIAEVRELCGARALGCYSRNTMVSIAEPAPIDGTTPEEVVRHEYGHHIALYRDNSPWRAIDWGPKRWATVATVCPKVTRGQAYPGDEGSNYSLNPGEAWAEVYRLLEERRAGITTSSWQIIAPSFFPDDPALQAAEQDVLQPWTKGAVAGFRKTFAKRTPKVWWIPLTTPLDGNLRITAALPKGGQHEVALVAANRKTVLRRALWAGQRAKRIDTAVCGQRSLFIRVTQAGALGRVSVSAATP